MRSKTLALASSPRSSSLSTDQLMEPTTGRPHPTDANDAANQAPLQAAGTAPPQWSSEQLLAGAEEATITHGDQVYRLRRTLTGKLILTK
jgi:hemin uptake protein HemP